MENKIVLEHNGGMAFETVLNGHKMTFDAEAAVGGLDRGPRPKPLLLLSLAGCTGMDVVSLLKKMRVEFTKFNVTVTGELTDEHPKYYHKIMVEYHIWGDHIDKAKMEKAVDLSQHRYCGVSFMLAKAAQLDYKIVYHQ